MIFLKIFSSQRPQSRVRINQQQDSPLSAGFLPTTVTEAETFFRSSSTSSVSCDLKTVNRSPNISAFPINPLKEVDDQFEENQEQLEIKTFKSKSGKGNSYIKQNPPNIDEDTYNKDDEVDEEIKRIMSANKTKNFDNSNNSIEFIDSNQKIEKVNSLEKMNNGLASKSNKEFAKMKLNDCTDKCKDILFFKSKIKFLNNFN